MPRDSQRVSDWIAKAEDDFAYAKAGERETGRHHITCFLCQQAAEKALKGLLVHKNELPPKTHNLSLLLGKVIVHFSSLDRLKDEIDCLEQYYLPTRYPDDIPLDISAQNAQQALAAAESILDAVHAELHTKKTR